MYKTDTNLFRWDIYFCCKEAQNEQANRYKVQFQTAMKTKYWEEIKVRIQALRWGDWPFADRQRDRSVKEGAHG